MAALTAIALPMSLPAPIARANPHVAGVSALGGVIVVLITLMGVFGDPRLAQPRAAIPIPLAEHATEHPAEDAATALETHDAAVDHAAGEEDQAAALRPPHAHHADTHDPILELRPHHDEASEPRLPGVTDLADLVAEETRTEPSPAGQSATALPPAPIEGLASPGPGGPLPTIGPDGARPEHAYARPFTPQGDRPLIAILVGGLGLSEHMTERAIATLPPEVTLSFVPYVADLQTWIDRARAAGHEVVLELPMEPYDFPANDPGPYTLLADADRAENARRLDWLMSRAAGYFGVMNYLGARFTASERAVAPLLRTLEARGVAVLHDGSTPRTALGRAATARRAAYAAADRLLDVQASRAAIDDQLLQLEALAIQNGDAFGVGAAFPVTIDHVAKWAESVEMKGYQLAPVSAIVARRADAADHGSDLASNLQGPAESPRAAGFRTVQAGFGPRAQADGDTEKKGGGH